VKAQPWGILRSALTLLSLRLILVQIALGMACFLLFSVWLNVPDASVLALVGSSLLGLVVFVGGALGETWLLLELAGQRRTRGRWIGGAFMLLGAVSLWLAFSGLVSHWSTYDWQVAGYLTSKTPSALRFELLYEHLDVALGWFWRALSWVGAGLIAAPAYSVIACGRPLRGIVATLRSLTFWVVLLVGSLAAGALTGLLLRWTPGHGFWIELTSLLLRLGLAIVLDAPVACLILCVPAACLRRVEEAYRNVAGGPETSQDLTAEAP
jgi:MFS family permease